MADTKFLKCSCAHCGGRIEFPAEGIGRTVLCPHCGWETELTLEAPAPFAVRSSRSRKWAIAGGVILAIGLVGAVSAVLVAQRLAKKQSLGRSTVPATGRSEPIGRTSGAKPNKLRKDSLVPSRPKRAASTPPASPAAAPLTSLEGLGFSASDVKIEKASGSSLIYATGTIKNDTEKQRFGVTVELDLFDNAGKQVGTAKDYKDAIEPRAQWNFRALLVNKNVASVRIATIREQP